MASGMVYTFKGGFRPKGRARPQDVGERLEQLRRDGDGVLDAVDVVVDARPDHSPLHGFFEWDDGKAAHAHRVDQAKNLIKAVSVIVPDSEVEQPAFTAAAKSEDGRPKFVRPDKTPAFTMPVKSRGDRLREALRDLRAIRQRYAQLDEFGPVWRLIDAEIAELERQGVLAGDEHSINSESASVA